MMKTIYSVCFTILAFPLASPVHACECAPSQKAFPEFKESDAVFTGRVVAMREVEVPGFGPTGEWVAIETEVTLVLGKGLKGVEGPEIRLSIGSCAFPFEVGKDYLVYADKVRGRLSTSYCSRTKELAEAGKDLREIAKGLKKEENSKRRTKPNNGMHPTRDTPPLINLSGAGGRVMPGVRPLS